jgi:prepilin-type processing-associated H-X9-DG protein/prepilin-type N-terminal cleavage/methylation domain-containing protein
MARGGSLSQEYQMSVKRVKAAFTLVELLVVIGIIALLISILLPALNKAREQANLIACAANLKQMGGLVQIYASENNGYFPYGHAQTKIPTVLPGDDASWGAYGQQNSPPTVPCWDWPDVLSRLTRNTPPGTHGTAYFSGWPNTGAAPAQGIEDNMAADFLPIFHDNDTPAAGYDVRVCDYLANCRLFADQIVADGVFFSKKNVSHSLPIRSQSSVKNSAGVMAVWCGPQVLGPGSGGRAEWYTGWPWTSTQLDNSAISWGGGYGWIWCYPFPFNTQGAGVTGNALVSLGNSSGDTFNSMDNNVSLRALQPFNKDSYTYAYASRALNDMRFRHMNNTETNALFADGHVESRKLADVHIKDLGVNFVTPTGAGDPVVGQ